MLAPEFQLLVRVRIEIGRSQRRVSDPLFLQVTWDSLLSQLRDPTVAEGVQHLSSAWNTELSQNRIEYPLDDVSGA